jgi:glycosyltransferase involved in cell wall biosynthesis
MHPRPGRQAPVRIAILNSHPIQYFAPLYAYLSRDPLLEVTALYCSDFSLRAGFDPGFKRPITWDVDLLEGYAHRFLGTRARTRTPGGFWSLICPEVWREIRSGRYDALVLHGYQHAVSVVAFLAAKSRRLRVFMRSETHLGLGRPAWKQELRDYALSVLYRFIDGFLAIGTANREYYRSLGIPESRIQIVPYAVDNDRFMEASRLSDDARLEVRRRFGLRPDQPVVLYASKLTRRKHPDDLVKAMKRLVVDGVRASLLLVGTGELEEELRSLVASLGVPDVVFGGFANQSELPSVLAASDVLVLPSEDEPWGLIVNEGMCAGLPVVVAEGVGCAPDLVREGVNGCLMETGDADSLARALRRILADAATRRSMGARSLEIIQGWGFERCRQGLREALGVADGSA